MTDWTAEEERVARAIVEAASGPFNVLSVRGKEAAIREARAAIAAMSSWRDVKTDPPPMDDWQPIETAPRDGRRFLTWCKTYGVRVGMAYNRADHDDWLSNLDAYGGSSKGGMRATHWMPLPPAPEPKP